MSKTTINKILALFWQWRLSEKGWKSKICIFKSRHIYDYVIRNNWRQIFSNMEKSNKKGQRWHEPEFLKKYVPAYPALKHVHGGVGALREALKADQVKHCHIHRVSLDNVDSISLMSQQSIRPNQQCYNSKFVYLSPFITCHCNFSFWINSMPWASINKMINNF